MNKAPKPLYRKINTNAVTKYHINHDFGSEARYDRNTKKGLNKNMAKNVKRGLDYTPLYRFLLSKVGQPWDVVYAEAKSRLPEGEADKHINWMFPTEGDRDYVRMGESTYYSALCVDENGLIQKAKDVKMESLWPYCGCCTHTFNGKVFSNKYNPLKNSY